MSNPTPELVARFPIGTRVRLTAEGRRVLGMTNTSGGTVTGYGRGFGLLRVRRDGNKRPETNHSGCWEPDPTAPAVAVEARNPESRVAFGVNGHQFVGECRGGRWSFTCPDWPDIEQTYAGASDTLAALEEFMRRALQNSALHVRELVSGVGGAS